MSDAVFTTDVGTEFVLDTGIELAGASNQVIKAKPPDGGALVSLLATIVETTKLKHVKTATTLATAGIWELQAYIEFTGAPLRGEIVKIIIEAPLT